VHERSGTDKPAAFADFDAALGMGRIIVWGPGKLTSKCFEYRMGTMFSFVT
jgi:hypothetical protein